MKVVVDTNVFVAAGFNHHSHSARLLSGIQDGTLEMVWHETTKQETRRMLERIPTLSWRTSERLFAPESEVRDSLNLADYSFIRDVDDRKFAALAELADCTIVTNDNDLLSTRGRLTVPVLTPREFIRALQDTTPDDA